MKFFGARKTLRGNPIADDAARWIVRRDRGLSANEAIEFEWWLAANEAHATELRQQALVWSKLEMISARTGSARKTRRRTAKTIWLLTGTFGAAAAILFLLAHTPRAENLPVAETPQVAHTVVLEDGTLVCLNFTSEIETHFTATERRVALKSGEAHFTVTKNRARPFIVHAGNVDVVAVGTAFDVNLQSAAVEVLVTEGKVQISQQGPVAENALVVPVLQSGQRAIVALAPASPATSVAVTNFSASEMAHSLAWQEPLLRFNGAPLAVLASEFEHRTARRIVLADGALAELRIGGRFRADDFDGFIRLLENNYGLVATKANDGSIVLSRGSQLAP